MRNYSFSNWKKPGKKRKATKLVINFILQLHCEPFPPPGPRRRMINRKLKELERRVIDQLKAATTPAHR